MSIHCYLNRTRPNRRFTLQKQNVLLCLLIVHILLIQPDTPGVLASENDDPLTIKDKWSKTINWTETKPQSSNAMTCLSFDDDTRENNCIQVIQASFSQIYYKTFNHTLEYRLIYSYSDFNTNFAVSVESSEANVEHPILFVVRQQKAVTSWELPYVIESSPGYQLGYNTFRRTLCPEPTTWMGSINQIVVDISTSSRSNVTFSLKMSVDSLLYVRLEEERRMWVTPSQNRIFKFTFPTSASQVAVTSKSPDDICLTVSVQSPQCPVFDTIYNVEYEGFRQTMTGQSTIIVQRNQYPEGFYLVYIVNTNDEKCVNSRIPAPFRANRTKEVTFTIQETVSVHEFRQVIFIGTMGVYAGFIALVIATCFLVEWRRKRSKQARREWEVTVNTYNKSELQPISEEQESQISSETIKTENGDAEFKCHETTSQDADDVFSDTTTRPTRQQNKLSSKRWRRVSEMTKHQPDFYNKKSKRYVSELCIIALFYLFPVGQVVWNYKDMMVTTGDQDMCYYNFACAYPYHLLIDFSDFNHFFSNIGYVVLGTIFLLITKRRDYIHTMQMRKNATGEQRGIPPHYGLSYSMGFGLIVEGILSSCYHLCPTRMNYQFDTSFMYVLAVLCTLKLYHARHADINVKSHMAYIVLALLVGLGAGTAAFTSQFYFKLGFTVVHLIACVALAIDVYYMGHWKLDKETMVEHVNTCCKSRPLYLERLTLVVVGIFCNVAFAISQLVIDSVDFNTHLLAVFMINLFVYSVFYVIMKMHKREWAFVTNRIYPFLFLLAALAFWLTGSYFFLKKAAKWELDSKNRMMVSTLRTPCAADQLLIEEVRQHEVLYACPTKSNKDNQLRDTAWQEIADAVGKSVEEAKERWRYMRDKYVKELGRNDKYRATNGGSVVEPPDATSFVGLMSFLNPFIKRKSSNGNRTSSSNENHFEMCINPHDMEAEFQSDDERNNSDGGNMEFVSSVSDDGHHLSNGNGRALVAIKKELVARGAAMSRRQQQQLRREQQNNNNNNNNGGDREICALPIEATVESVDVSNHYHPPSKRQRIQPSTAVHHQEDTTSLFCASIAGMLAELQPYHRERIKRDIYNLVSDALLTELSN